MSKWKHFQLWAEVTWDDIRDWCLRWVYAQHNARVIVDFENRMTSVVYDASGGMMSKPYYTVEAMAEQIADAKSRAYDNAYADGRRDLAEELGVDDPSPCVPE